MFRELFVIFEIIQIVKQMQYFVFMQIYEYILSKWNMTCSITSRQRKRQSSQGSDNLDMVGHSEMEGSRCNVIMKKNLHLCNLKYYQHRHSIYTLLWQFFFCSWIENGCKSIIEWANVLLRDWKLFWRLL
jgi:hypothetical protein